ncbi:MAG: OmpA family protein [Shewanella sp.]
MKNSQSRWITLALLLFSLSLTSSVFAWSDTDRDGVPDIKDACPNTEPNTPVMANGCVEEITVEMTASPVCDMSHSNAELNPDCHHISAAMVYFEFAIAEVDFSQWKNLALVKAFLETNDVELTLVGHTDIVGTPEFNYQLSLQRAQNVKRILVEDYGFNPNRFTVMGKGISEPVADNRSSEGRSLNRRVEFIVNNN